MELNKAPLLYHYDEVEHSKHLRSEIEKVKNLNSLHAYFCFLLRHKSADTCIENSLSIYHLPQSKHLETNRLASR